MLSYRFHHNARYVKFATKQPILHHADRSLSSQMQVSSEFVLAMTWYQLRRFSAIIKRLGSAVLVGGFIVSDDVGRFNYHRSLDWGC